MIGLGAMGSGLADSLIANVFDVTVWNRTPGRKGPTTLFGRLLSRLSNCRPEIDQLVGAA
jgi:3-hydroxyisobutyrate dehydrogenase